MQRLAFSLRGTIRAISPLSLFSLLVVIVALVLVSGAVWSWRFQAVLEKKPPFLDASPPPAVNATDILQRAVQSSKRSLAEFPYRIVLPHIDGLHYLEQLADIGAQD